MSDIQFVNPEFLWLLIAIPLFLGLGWYYRLRRNLSFRYVLRTNTDEPPKSWRSRLQFLPVVLRSLAWVALVLALARPRTSTMNQKTMSTAGIDVVVALDVSTSMKAMDFKPNRLEAAKRVASEFISERPQDRFGLVLYAGESFTQTPLTSDHRIVQSAMSLVDFGKIDDGTAIGMGLATAVNRLKDSEAKSKVIILMSDGVNNSGFIDPKTAADLASTYRIRVYTIGVGTEGKAPYPQTLTNGRTQVVPIDVQIDEPLLRDIASRTGGRYFRATDDEKLIEIYSEIDQMERTKLSELTFYQYTELFYGLLAAAMGLIFLAEAWNKIIAKKLL